MHRTDPRRAAELTAYLARVYPGAPAWRLARAVVAATRAAKRAKRTAEQNCNGELNGQAAEHAARRIERAAERLTADLRDAVGLADSPAPGPYFRLGGDPRGACGWLHIPERQGDGFAADAGFPLY